jgi:hypothetical protein
MTTNEAADRLGEQVATVCDLSGLDVVGFVVLVNDPETDTLTAEARAHIAPAVFDDILRAYLDTRL